MVRLVTVRVDDRLLGGGLDREELEVPTDDEAEAFVHAAGADVRQGDVEDRCLTAGEDAGRDPVRERRGETAAASRRMGAHGADLGELGRLQPLAGHRDECAVLVDPEVVTELDRPRTERPGLGEFDERQHLRNVGRRERLDPGVDGRCGGESIEDHLVAEATTDASPVGRRVDVATAGEHHDGSGADEPPQVGPRALRRLFHRDETGHVGIEAPSEAGPFGEPGMRRRQRAPHEVVEDLHLFVRQVGGVMFCGGHRRLRAGVRSLGGGWLVGRRVDSSMDVGRRHSRRRRGRRTGRGAGQHAVPDDLPGRRTATSVRAVCVLGSGHDAGRPGGLTSEASMASTSRPHLASTSP